MHKKDILEKLNKIKKVHIPIIGDIMLDHYSWGEVERISPEAPVPVVKIIKDEFMLGGAGNVACNIKSLSSSPILFSIIGKDDYGQKIKQLLKQNNIKFFLHQSLQRSTTLKTRVLAQNQQMIRIDRESDSYLASEELLAIKQQIDKIQQQYIIISDYGKGCICPEILEMLQTKKLIVDPKAKNYPFYKGFYLLTPNKKEAEQAANLKITDTNTLIKAGKIIISKFDLENLIITLGPQGMAIFQKNKPIYHLPTCAQKVFDVTGAGDTVIAVLAIGLANNLDLISSAILANYAAGLVVAQVGTATTSLQAIKKHIQNSPKIKLTKLN